MVADPVLESNTWERIADASANNLASSLWNIGDTKIFTLTTGEQLVAEIIDFNHDDLSDGSGKAGITFCLKDAMAEERSMDSINSNSLGYSGTGIYAWLNNTLYSQLPSDLRSVIKTVNKVTSVGGEVENEWTPVELVTDQLKVFLLSEEEVSGNTNAGSAPGQGYQYPKFVNVSDRIKKPSGVITPRISWGLRSPYIHNNYGFITVTRDGSINRSDASNERYVVFAFCI